MLTTTVQEKSMEIIRMKCNSDYAHKLNHYFSICWCT